MTKTKWNIEAVKAYETGQGVELVNEPYPQYKPLKNSKEQMTEVKHMTKEEVIDLAEQIGLLHDGDWWFSNDRDYSDVYTNDLVALINAAIKKQFSIT